MEKKGAVDLGPARILPAAARVPRAKGGRAGGAKPRHPRDQGGRKHGKAGDPKVIASHVSTSSNPPAPRGGPPAAGRPKRPWRPPETGGREAPDYPGALVGLAGRPAGSGESDAGRALRPRQKAPRLGATARSTPQRSKSRSQRTRGAGEPAVRTACSSPTLETGWKE